MHTLKGCISPFSLFIDLLWRENTSNTSPGQWLFLHSLPMPHLSCISLMSPWRNATSSTEANNYLHLQLCLSPLHKIDRTFGGTVRRCYLPLRVSCSFPWSCGTAWFILGMAYITIDQCSQTTSKLAAPSSSALCLSWFPPFPVSFQGAFLQFLLWQEVSSLLVKKPEKRFCNSIKEIDSITVNLWWLNWKERKWHPITVFRLATHNFQDIFFQIINPPLCRKYLQFIMYQDYSQYKLLLVSWKSSPRSS